MSIPAHLLVHTVSVEPKTGSGAYGDVFGTPVALACYVERKRNLVRDANGDEVVSETMIYANLDCDAIPAGSRITVAGATSTVISSTILDDRGVTGLAHQEIALR